MASLYNKVDKTLLKKKLHESAEKRITLSFYKYHYLNNPRFFRNHLYVLLDSVGVLGRIYVADEGVNGQISVPEKNKSALIREFDKIDFLKGIRLNYAIDDNGKSFFKLMIKVRNKIVADGLKEDAFDVTDKGVHVDAENFNRLADDPNTVILDMRNHYESEVGHFRNAVTPDVETFRESLPIIENMLEDQKEKNLLMYCTGGIRCEKASAYYKSKGFKNVFQLDGGIIEYARDVKNKNLENKFIGKNFVFDERLGERISEEIIARCHQCGKVCDTHINCENDACHILFIQCDECAETYEHCCSSKCKDFKNLPEEKRSELKTEIEFNGTKFGKGRYKAAHKDEPLELI